MYTNHVYVPHYIYHIDCAIFTLLSQLYRTHFGVLTAISKDIQQPGPNVEGNIIMDCNKLKFKAFNGGRQSSR